MSTAAAARAPRNAKITWILFGAILVILAIAIGATVMDRSQTRRILFANTPVPAARLAGCLSSRLPLAGAWEIASGPPEKRHAWNAAHDVRVDIVDNGVSRRLDLSTPGARPMQDSEAAALKACLSGA